MMSPSKGHHLKVAFLQGFLEELLMDLMTHECARGCKGAESNSAMQAISYSVESHFTTAPIVGPNSSVSMIVWADSGQAIADGSYEWEW